MWVVPQFEKRKCIPQRQLRSQSVYCQSGFLSGLCVFVGNSIETDALPGCE